MKITTLFLFFAIYGFSVFAQENSHDFEMLQQHIAQYSNSEETAQQRIVKIQKSFNPVKMVLYVPLYFYQRLVSEQISAVCSFEPSCSAFSILAIKRLGFVKGLFLTADRLTRCNGEAQRESENYLFDPLKAKVIDAPDMYRVRY